MRRALNVISGQVHGKVDWISQDRREIGMFIKTSVRASTRCIVMGSEVEALLANNLLLKGMMITAHGEFFARVFHRKENNTLEGEVICQASRLITETPPRDGRPPGAVYAALKGVVMHWSEQHMQIKTFLNFQEEGRPTQMTCSILLTSWCRSMPPAVKANFLSSIKSGREFTANCLVEASAYMSREQLPVPCLYLLPLDFKLQG